MVSRSWFKLWLPYFIGLIGISLSFYAWHVLLFDIQAYFEWMTAIKVYLPWVALLAGVSFSVLIAVLTHMVQVAKIRESTLDSTNESLKKEINERINAEKVKQKMEVALFQGQKLQAMGTLAGGIAHDFNNILYAILGYVEMAREDVDKETLLYGNLGKVLEAAHRGQELVSRILAFSRRQHHQLEVIHLKPTIEAALSLLRPTIPASVMITFDAEIDPIISGNQTQIHQVFVNLINNGVDAMDGEGTIMIHMTNVPANTPLLRQFPGTRDRHYCKIEITDTGHGMDKHTMERIFEPFFTTKEVGKGTGLGLSIVHTIIKEHQGEITVKSQLGRGTTFMILLPEYQVSLS